MHLEIVTPDKKIFEGEVKSVKLPGSEGSFGILNNHAPIIATLGSGSIKIVDEKENASFFNVKSGIVEVINNKIIVLTELV